MLIYSKNVDVNLLEKKLRNRLSNFDFFYKGDAVVTSGLRTPKTNQDVGGSPTSSHLKGLACDISCSSSKEAFGIVETALRAGFRRIGIANDHIHLDVDPDKVQNVIWLE